MDKITSNDLLDDSLSDTSSEDSFKLYKGMQRIPGVCVQMPFQNAKIPVHKLFARTSPSVLRIRKSLLVKGLTASKKAPICSTPMMKIVSQSNASSENSLQFSPIKHVKDIGNYMSDNEVAGSKKSNNANNQKGLRRSKSYDKIAIPPKKTAKHTNPIINSVVEQLQNLSTKYKKDENNRSKQSVKPRQCRNNATFTKMNAILSTSTKGKSTENKEIQKKPVKPSLVSKNVGTSPAEEIIKAVSVSPRNRKKTILVETETQTTDSLIKLSKKPVENVKNITQEPSNDKITETHKAKKTKEPNLHLEYVNANIRKDVQINLLSQNEFSESETCTPQASEIQSRDVSSQLSNFAVSEREVAEFLESFDNNRNMPSIIEISSSLETLENEKNASVTIKAEVVDNNYIENFEQYSIYEELEENQNNINNVPVIEPLNEISNSLRSKCTPQKQNYKLPASKTANNNNRSFASPNTRSTQRNKETAVPSSTNREKENSKIMNINNRSFASPNTRSTQRNKETAVPSSTSSEKENSKIMNNNNRSFASPNTRSTQRNKQTAVPNSTSSEKENSKIMNNNNHSFASPNTRSTQNNKETAVNNNNHSVASPNTRNTQRNKETAVSSSTRSEKGNSSVIEKTSKRSTKVDKANNHNQMSTRNIEETFSTATLASDTLRSESVTTITSKRSNEEDNSNQTNIRKRVRPKRSKMNIYKPPPSKSRRKSTQQHLPIPSKALKSEKSRLTQSKSTILQPYLAINRFSGFIQVHRDNEVDQENEDEPTAIRRSTRIRNLPQIYIQSSILNPSVLRPRSKKKISDTQSNQTTSVKENSVEESKSRNKRKTTVPLESTKEQVISSKKKRRTSIKRQSNNKKELKSRRKIETRGSSKVYDKDDQRLQENNEEPRSPITEDIQEESTSLKTISIRSDILKPDKSQSKKYKSEKKNGENNKNDKNNTEALINNCVSETLDSGVCVSANTGITAVHEDVFAQPMLLDTVESNYQEEIAPVQLTSFNIGESELPKENETVETSTVPRQTRLNSSNASKLNDKLSVSNNNHAAKSRTRKNVFNNARRDQKNNTYTKIDNHTHIEAVPSTSKGIVYNSEINHHAEVHDIEHESLTVSRSEGRNNPEVTHDLNVPAQMSTNDIHQTEISRKRSVTFLEPTVPKVKNRKLASRKNTTHLDENHLNATRELPDSLSKHGFPAGEINMGVIESTEQEDDNEEEANTSSNVLHAVVNNEVISRKWFVDVPALPNCVNGIMVKYTLKNVKSSWGYTSYGYVIIGPREKKPLQVVKKHNIVYRVEQGHGIIVAQKRRQFMKVGRMFHIPLGVEYSITNLLDEPLILSFQKSTP